MANNLEQRVGEWLKLARDLVDYLSLRSEIEENLTPDTMYDEEDVEEGKRKLEDFLA